MVRSHHRAVLAAAARPVLAGRRGGPTLHRGTRQDVVPVGRALRVDRAALLIERGVVVDVGLLRVKLPPLKAVALAEQSESGCKRCAAEIALRVCRTTIITTITTTLIIIITTAGGNS
jgi:hypothetical protein